MILKKNELWEVPIQENMEEGNEMGNKWNEQERKAEGWGGSPKTATKGG